MKIEVEKILNQKHMHELLLFLMEIDKVINLNNREKFESYINEIRNKIRIMTKTANDTKVLHLLLIKSVMLDLCGQGWKIKITGSEIELFKDDHSDKLSTEIKSSIRNSHLLLRDEQLNNSSVREFILKMERPKVTSKGWHSIFSLMRDGDELYKKLIKGLEFGDLKERNNYLKGIILPYIQFAEADKRCEFTNLPLSDIWRYFRHTWVTPYKMLPGRSIAILIRDAAVPNHPVIGIGALGSSVAQHSTRDKWIGWESKDFVLQLRNNPNTKVAKLLHNAVDKLIDNIYKKDLLKEKIITKDFLFNPTTDGIKILHDEATNAKSIHWKNRNKTEYNALKQNHPDFHTDWEKFAKLPLFRSKRCENLANLLTIKRTFSDLGFKGNKKELINLLDNPNFRSTLSSLIRKIKSERVGINMMDIVVCGAIAPYQSILGGKLVCHMMVSPEINNYYSRKYKNNVSIIASSMKGEKVKYKQDLVFLGTTSLYGNGSSQYNRIKIPIKKVGGTIDGFIEYKELGVSEGFGSFHFSQTSLDLMEMVVNKDERGKIVNRIFGEGANPLMRLIRQALNAVNLPSKDILNHGYKRVVYGIALASNFRDILFGLSKNSNFLLPKTKSKDITNLLSSYWIERWLSKRIENPEALLEVKKHTLVHPIEHGARVNLPEIEEYSLFNNK